MSTELSLRQASKAIGVPYITVMSYDLKIRGGLPTKRAGNARMINPETLRRVLKDAGYRFTEPQEQEKALA